MSDSRTVEWKGDKPFFLVIREYKKTTDPSGRPVVNRESTVIDLDEGGWVEKNKHLMRVPGVWMLCSKAISEKVGQLAPVLIMQVEDGDQPYYTTKHIGIMSFGDGEPPESVVYGIGKKRHSGEVQRLWVLPNGMMCGGEDVYWIADYMNKGQL